MTEVSGPVGATETHISQLFFTPDRVFKLLKPVENSFLSFAGTEQRLAAATAEFLLNRRIAPDVYLGVADVVEDEVIADRLIVMRRLPAERQLHRLVHGDVAHQHVREAARAIATFHSHQAPVTGDRAWMARADNVGANWRDNFSVLSKVRGSLLDGDDVDRVEHLVETYLRGRETLFDERIADGRVRDGHGDLRAEHVFCLDDGPRIIDCLAFRDDFRIADVLCDIGFLAMDLHRLAGPALAASFVHAYDEFTAERHPSTLAHHYVAYRAHVRAKVAALRFGQGDPAAATEVADYHRLALDHLEVGQVRLVLVGGGAGAGKSTVAEGLAAKLGAVWLRSDEARRTAVRHTTDAGSGSGSATSGGRFDAPGAGRYGPEAKDAVYAEILREAEELLVRGESVVLDATWSSEHHRELARVMGARTSAALCELHCVLPLAVAQERIARRMAAVWEPSEATPEIAAHLAEQFEPWPEANPVNTAGTIPAAIDAAVRTVVSPQPRRAARRDTAVQVGGAIVFDEDTIRFLLATRRTTRQAPPTGRS